MSRPRRFPHRLLIVIPVGRIPAFKTWWLSKARTGELPHDDPAEWTPIYNDSGTIVRRMSCAVYTRSQATVLLRRMALMSGQAAPNNWASMTDEEKRIWTIGVRDALFANTGVWIAPAHAHQGKIDARAQIENKGLGRIERPKVEGDLK